MKVAITPQFKRMFKKLEFDLQQEALEKIDLFQADPNHSQLKLHKLKGRLKDRYSFSVNYKVRIIYKPLTKTAVAFLAIGDHDVYKN